MAWIKTIPPADATGSLKKIYDEAIRRAGRVYKILEVQSLNPGALQAGLGQYMTIMFGKGELSRTQREMLATVVSAANHCHY